MSKIIIVRNEHPNEVGAFYLAKKAFYKIKQKYIECILETVPFVETELGSYFKKEKSYNGNWSDRVRGRSDRNDIIFSFHNSPYHCIRNKIIFGKDLKGMARGDPKYFEFYEAFSSGNGIAYFGNPFIDSCTIEFPAIYKPIKNINFLSKVPSKEKIYSLFFESICKVNFWNVVDFKATKEAGLLEDIVVDKTVDGILNMFNSKSI